MNPKIEYIDSKLDYKNDLIIDLYVFSLKRTKDQERGSALATALKELSDNDNKVQLEIDKRLYEDKRIVP